MIKEKLKHEKTFKDFLKENLENLTSVRTLIAFFCLFITAVIAVGIKDTLRMFSHTLWLSIIICVMLIDVYLHAIASHFHVRSPQYKKYLIKEQELAKKRAEKAVKKAIEAVKPPVNIN